MLRSLVRMAARNGRLATALDNTPAGRVLASRHLGPADEARVIEVARGLADTERLVALEPLRHPAGTVLRAQASEAAYLRLLDRLSAAGIEGAEVSVRLAALVADADPGPVARSHLVTVCRAAEQQGHRISLDPEGARGAGAGLALAQDLHAEFRGTLGVQLPAHLHRAETDAQLLAEKGMRVRLVRLSVRPVADAAHVEPAAVDRSFVRCLRILMEGADTPVIATHDPRLLAIGADLVRRQHREATAQEFLLDHRMHPVDRRRLIAAGLLVRTNLPYGEDWSCYLARRLTEDPGGLSELPRGLVHRTD
ncbi:proline dehydrogenase [Enemella evansiae]|uniref:proline dehydrogenase family protein n=1 Tax=Enemella evansiae TaxID=2016499 RepID=UPI000B97C8A2|nr:proline dehydrogenase family protein [Enemella evansiae]OYN97655.1 proline dehydrogenase [Enemella evansiae]